MAFTHTHINAYVIVGGDSDFITLVEKLKQYDKQVFVVGGRSFTSLVMQRNCHEFIAYENLVGGRRGADRRQTGPVSQVPIDQAVPLVRRALKVLTDREVTPQLGLLKSTLLQLDSTFSERTYGVTSFRDFAQKLASAGHVTLREHGRNVLVELRDGAPPADVHGEVHRRVSDAPASPSEPPEPRAADGVRELRRIFESARTPPRWPMYLRQAKQYIRNVDGSFDERKFGFGNLLDLLRAAQREGLLKVERDRQGSVRLFPGSSMPSVAPEDDDNRGNVAEPVTDPAVDAVAQEPWMETDAAASEPDTDVVEAETVQEIEVAPVVDAEELPQEKAADAAPRGRRTRTPRTPRKRSESPRPRKSPRR
jgi:hypothetical protein